MEDVDNKEGDDKGDNDTLTVDDDVVDAFGTLEDTTTVAFLVVINGVAGATRGTGVTLEKVEVDFVWPMLRVVGVVVVVVSSFRSAEAT
jgi:hypothetical protein